MKILYYDCFCGISGDMNLGALIDLGVDRTYLLDKLSLLNLNEKYEIVFKSETKNGIAGTSIDIRFAEDQKNFAGLESDFRTFSDIKKIIEESALTAGIKNRSIRMFELLAEAESKVHGISKEQVHFHEVGALDSILDIVGAAVCLDYLQVDRIMSSSVELGGGFVRCAHGLLPVPAPAVAELLKGFPIKKGRVGFETTTPTGAAILVANVQEFADCLEFIIEKIGYGLGKRDSGIPNVLRVYLGTVQQKEQPDPLIIQEDQCIIETNLDDMNPELYEIVEERLFRAGALDVFKTPIIMKKGRPAIKLSILTTPEKAFILEKVIFTETSAIGLRKHTVEKRMLPRRTTVINTKYGQVSVKYSFYQGKIIKGKAEYEDCKRLAKENNITLAKVYREVNSQINDLLPED